MTEEGDAAGQQSSRRGSKQGVLKTWKLVLRRFSRAPHHSDLTWLPALLVTSTLTAFCFGVPVVNREQQ